MIMRSASYTYLSEGDWDERISRIDLIAENCQLCPRRCRVNRLVGEKGFCAAPSEMIISSIFPHHGEEPPISGEKGSGTVFFSYCTLKCCYCQNYQISHEHEGKTYSIEELADKMLHLQELGCHNINLVTATHFLPWILKALRIAAKKGLNLPIVYNCGGYELCSTISLLSGIVDIYLPDMKYGIEKAAAEYSCAPDYVQINRDAIREMFRQTGPLRLDSDGIAWRGLCIRHLVLPGNLESSRSIYEFLRSVFDPEDISISLMAQYKPLYKADQFETLRETLSPESYSFIKELFISAGFGGYYQELEQLDKSFLIDFKSHKDKPLTGQ
jgi:putative pyruvate formate lyase activating enzyme